MEECRSFVNTILVVIKNDMQKAIQYLLLIILCSCTNRKPDIEGSLINKYGTCIEEINFASDTSLVYNFKNDSGVISTNCNYFTKEDSLFIISSQIQNYISHLSIVDTFRLENRTTLIQISTKNRFLKIEGFVSLVN
jgi:hypothetical protein